jgi:hypothetical protein
MPERTGIKNKTLPTRRSRNRLADRNLPDTSGSDCTKGTKSHKKEMPPPHGSDCHKTSRGARKTKSRPGFCALFVGQSPAVVIALFIGNFGRNFSKTAK